MKTAAVSACISEYKTEYKTVRAINVTACAAPSCWKITGGGIFVLRKCQSVSVISENPVSVISILQAGIKK